MCKRLIALSLLLLLAFSSTSFGQAITIQQTQYDSLKNLTQDLKTDLLLLKESTNLNISDLNTYKAKLITYDKKLQEMSVQLQLSQSENLEIKKLLNEALQESQNFKALLTKLEKEIKTLKRQRDAGFVVGIIGVLLAIFR